ncbi:uncharacterized protein LOC112052729 [Bicyclus anynana]|uniref:Uncharacterized protein LOC112052729 n=1 Tax=Bicyclus anynana TaxID=110368 RepID=A0A6J1NIV4_BICAN|nr:uncharacterized protein LOC112052729 [Bicyclus anynana]
MENDQNKPHKQRFKGIENFLRRVAFNLGNSPSQTEVKIISCVPIDVTDLQHRIQHLERQLQEVSKKKLPKTPATPPPQTPPPSSMWSSPMMQPSMMQPSMMWPSPMMQPPVCWPQQPMQPCVCPDKGLAGQQGQSSQPGLAGVQGLVGQAGLQGLAGQAPAQPQPAPCTFTEPCVWYSPKSDSGATGVKPTVVKPTVSVKSSKTKKGGTVVNTALLDTYSGQSVANEYSSDKSSRSIRSRDQPTYSGCRTSKQARQSNVSFVLHAITADNQAYYDFSSNDKINLDKTDPATDNISILKRRKKKKVAKKKSKLKAQLVYYAQHKHNDPFNKKYNLTNFVSSKTDTFSISHAYLGKVIRKQYDPKYVVQEFSDTSHFSQPVCKDNGVNSIPPRMSESDVCSCCHGRFQNVDNYMPKGFDSLNNITKYDKSHTNKLYYDSNLYDVVPVKENTNNKYLKERFLPKRNIENKLCPEHYRNKYEYNPKAVNIQAEKFLTRHNKSIAQKIKRKKMLDQYIAEQQEINKKYHKINKESQNIYPSGCGDISKNKPLFVENLNKTTGPVKTILLKNVSIGSDNLTSKLLCNNQSTQLESISDETKTESTLNQIKSILQSVLTEVKANAIVTAACETMTKRDAFVQIGFSQNNLQGRSTLLRSYTYNHSSNENPYLPSCSRQMCTAQYYLPGFPYQPSFKYLQNFPVIVHPSGRHLCDCYYKNSLHKYSKYKEALAATTATNKEVEGAGNKETKKLIKEIYKSVAMNMDFPSKEKSTSEYEDTSSAKNDLINDLSKKSIKDIRGAGIELVNKKNVEVEASISSNLSNNNGALCAATHTQADRKARYDKLTRHEATHRYQQHSTDTIVEDDEEINASSDNTDDTEDTMEVKVIKAQPKHVKKSLLRRMFQSVKVFKRRKADSKTQIECADASEASDSDDYETIYSGRSVVPAKNRQTYKHKSRAMAESGNQNACTRSLDKRPPYLEQEYRRQWNERLIFDKQERKHSSKGSYYNQSPEYAHPAFWNSYEARTATEEGNLSNQLKPISFKMKGNRKVKQESLKK